MPTQPWPAREHCSSTRLWRATLACWPRVVDHRYRGKVVHAPGGSSGRIRSTTVKLLVVWLAFHGFFQALPQVVLGALIPGNDVGMAMDYFHLPSVAKGIAALAALAAMPPIAARLAKHLLSIEPVLFRIATVPALVAIPLTIVFRVPRAVIEVLVPPVLVAVVGLAALHSVAWKITDARPSSDAQPISIAYPLVTVVALLLVFQLILRPGIAFY